MDTTTNTVVRIPDLRDRFEQLRRGDQPTGSDRGRAVVIDLAAPQQESPNEAQ